MSAMDALEDHLQSLRALKPPGVTKTKIEQITTLCIQNVQFESTVVQKIYTHFKKSPATHKLGVLYVVDSVTRQWAEKARQAGQVAPGSAVPEGSYASGVQKVKELLPLMMNELLQSAPETQKEKISKLLDIWERGQTFPAHMLAGFKQKLSNPQANPQSFTPEGSPLRAVAAQGHSSQNQSQPAPPVVPVPQDASSILAALASLGNANPPSAAQVNTVPAGQMPYTYTQNVAPPPQSFVAPPNPPAPPINGQGAVAAPPALSNEVVMQLITALAQGLIPPDQAGPVIAAIAASQNGALPSIVPPPPMPPQMTENVPSVQQNGRQPEPYEPNGSRYRERSRSPDYNRRRASPNRRSPPVNRRDSPTYGVYDPNAGAEGNSTSRHDDRGRGRGRNRGQRNDYRQRSPPPQRRQQSPILNAPHGMQPKYIEYDKNLPRDHIRVLSRTLFVGGASATEGELRNMFSRYGKVQTCIVNHEKRHAFVKMVNRPDALAAKEGMDRSQDPDVAAKARQTRWGVGFGPRECSDYSSGISVIPINRLTDADRKWVLTAEYGGTGGNPIEGGMVIEEPDIEIGAGVSSKAISRRMPPDGGRGRGGGNVGPRGGFDSGAPRFRKPDRAPEPRHVSPRPEAIGVPPPVPGFGFPIPGMPSGF